MKRSTYLDDEDYLDRETWDEVDEPDPLDPFFADGSITDILGELKSGKEGTVYVCRANPSLGHNLVAAKVYRSRQDRSFRNSAVYLQGRSFGKHRENRAVKTKTRKGREIEFSAWLSHEWTTLRLLSQAGADVPQPIAHGGGALLMEYIGGDDGPGTPLQETRIEAHEARPLFERVMRNVELFLRCDTVHADLSAYNILYRQGRVTVIDFPQAVDPRANEHALSLLARDIGNVCRYFGRYGVRSDPDRITHHLWGRYRRQQL